MNSNYEHVPVMLRESIDAMNIKSDGIYVDCTLGGGGHSLEILKKLETGHLYCFEQDSFAISFAEKKLSEISNNFTIIHSNFVNLKSCLGELGIDKVDGILYDLGGSSFQIDIPNRGFSYILDGPLDMRMDQNNQLTAYNVVNEYSENELKRVLYEFGEEKYAPLIAKKIVKERQNKEIETTFDLVNVIRKALPAKILRIVSHPEKKTFQAIRIEVNKELEVLKKSLLDGLDLLKIGGRAVVISFHSLEDRIVKNTFKNKATLNLPNGLPFIPEGYIIKFKIINNKVIVPNSEELKKNSRSHSSKLRIIEKIN